MFYAFFSNVPFVFLFSVLNAFPFFFTIKYAILYEITNLL